MVVVAAAGGLLALLGAGGAGGASSAGPQHGIGFTEGCTSPTDVGEPYTCLWTVRNVLDEAQDTLTITQLTDTVHSAGGNVVNSTVLDSAPVTPSGGATCTAPPNRVCTLPFGSQVAIGPFTHYTVTGADFAGANPLTDSSDLTWHDLCDDPTHTGSLNCVPNPPNVGAASQSVIGAGGAGPGVQHGIGFTKGCIAPTKVGDPYACAWTVRNVLDQAEDTLTITQIIDTVHAGAPFGNQVNSAVLANAPVVVNNPALVTCAAASGDGTTVPYLGVTSCTIKFGGRVDVGPFSFYTVHPTDLVGANPLTDDTTLVWHDLCDDPTHTGNTNCVGNPPNVGAASRSVVVRRASVTSTTIHNAAHGPVTVVDAGSLVHDFAAVTTNDPSVLQPMPSGTVTVDFFTGNQCLGNPVATSTPIPLGANGTVDATGFTQGPLAAGLYGFLAHYAGDNTYAPSNGPCEPLRVVDANLQLAPATATNPVNANHILTCHINVNDGTGEVNAPNGTVCTVAIISGPGTPDTQNCTVSGATGSCLVTITSATAGTSVIRASTNITVAGLVVHRETGDGHPGDGPNAQKAWIAGDANIQISPQSAQNPTGANHTLTGHVNVSTDGTTFTNAPAGTLITFTIVSGPGSLVGGVNTCTTVAATGSCTVQITSTTAATTVIRAATDVTVNGIQLHRETNDGHTGDSPDAQKAWLAGDANIQISPQAAENLTGTNHTLTGHVNVSTDGTTFTNAPTGTQITFSVVSGPGSFVGGVSTCTTVAATGSCTVQITSTTAGTTVTRAATDVTVNGNPLHRETNDGHQGDSPDARKMWVKPTGIIAPASTSCNDVLNGTAQSLAQVNYSIGRGRIGQGINPGVFFYYVKITTTTPNQVVTVTESNTSTNNTPLFGILNGQAWLWNASCSSFAAGTTSGQNGGNASFTVPVPGDYIIGFKYQTKTIAGAPAPVPATVTYNFVTSLGIGTTGSVLLKKS